VCTASMTELVSEATSAKPKLTPCPARGWIVCAASLEMCVCVCGGACACACVLKGQPELKRMGGPEGSIPDQGHAGSDVVGGVGYAQGEGCALAHDLLQHGRLRVGSCERIERQLVFYEGQRTSGRRCSKYRRSLVCPLSDRVCCAYVCVCGVCQWTNQADRGTRD
jgi:hypothetical protein